MRCIAAALLIGFSSFAIRADANQANAIEEVLDRLRGVEPLIAHEGPVTEDQKVETVRAIGDAVFKLESIFRHELESR
jgi:hypothetical protein